MLPPYGGLDIINNNSVEEQFWHTCHLYKNKEHNSKDAFTTLTHWIAIRKSIQPVT